MIPARDYRKWMWTDAPFVVHRHGTRTSMSQVAHCVNLSIHYTQARRRRRLFILLLIIEKHH